MAGYAARVCADMASFRQLASHQGAAVCGSVDTIYLGGGTPSLLPDAELKKIFSVLENEFDVVNEAEITVECAPGTLIDKVIETLLCCGVNRVSLGVQSFVDKEAASVARLHTQEKILDDIERLRRNGITNINVDLIAGLPHQTRESWTYSLEQAIATEVPHVSVYMLEVDEDSRLGRELMAGGTKYHAHFAPDDDLTAEFYETACERLNAGGVKQYEISNFARASFESRHNLKYWTRQPYMGFGVDAHSMLPASDRSQSIESWRFATTDSFDGFFTESGTKANPVMNEQAIEESFFLGLRLNRGVSLDGLRGEFGDRLDDYNRVIDELVASGLLAHVENMLRLTPRGRMLSNEVFERFIVGQHQLAVEGN
jgi:oxygen-independent coproporphyrinogen-3 oxidase